jgi:hypothetical protein
MYYECCVLPDPTAWKTVFIVIYLVSLTFDLILIPGVLYEQMR